MEIIMMKRFLPILMTAMFFAPIIANYDVSNKPNTQKNQSTSLKEVGTAAVATTAVALWGAGLVYLIYKMYLLENGHNEIRRQAIKTATDKVEDLIKSGVLEAVPSHMTPSEYRKKVINIAISSGNKLTSHLPDEVIQVLKRGFSSGYGIIAVPFVYLGLTAWLVEQIEKAEQYFSTKSPEGLAK